MKTKKDLQSRWHLESVDSLDKIKKQLEFVPRENIKQSYFFRNWKYVGASFVVIFLSIIAISNLGRLTKNQNFDKYVESNPSSPASSDSTNINENQNRTQNPFENYSLIKSSSIILDNDSKIDYDSDSDILLLEYFKKLDYEIFDSQNVKGSFSEKIIFYEIDSTITVLFRNDNIIKVITKDSEKIYYVNTSNVKNDISKILLK